MHSTSSTVARPRRPRRRRHAPAPAGPSTTPARLRRRRALGLAGTAVLLVLVVAASLAWGSREMGLATVVEALTSPRPGNNDHTVVLDLRVPRTVVGALGGVALGLVGALLQGLTRNPIADPGILGINAGASLMVIVAITSLDIATAGGYVWFAFTGAAVAAGVVYGAASLGWDGVTPVKLALVGAALTAVATSLVTLVLLVDHRTLEEYRFWAVGSLVGRSLDTATVLAPFLLVGTLLALSSARALNALALGDDLARGLGQGLARGRLTVVAAVVLLSGAATSLVGPVAFVGLVVPHVARAMAGPDHRWVLPLSGLLGAVLLLAADVVGRVVARPSEIEAGLVVAFLGAPVMVWLIRRSRAVAL
jgi:iron complex transport system permease protein